MSLQTLSVVMDTLFPTEKKISHSEIWVCGYNIKEKEWVFKTKNEKNEFQENKTTKIIELFSSMQEKKKIEIKLFKNDILNYNNYKKCILEILGSEFLEFKINNVFELRIDLWALDIFVEKFSDIFVSIEKMIIMNDLNDTINNNPSKYLDKIKNCKNFGFYNFPNVEILKVILISKPNHLFFSDCGFLYEKNRNIILKYLDFKVKSIKINNENKNDISLSQLQYSLVNINNLFLQKQKITDIFNLSTLSSYVQNIHLKYCDMKSIYKYTTRRDDCIKKINKIVIYNCDFDLYSLYIILSTFRSIEKVELKYEKKNKLDIDKRNLENIWIFLLSCYLIHMEPKVNFSELEKFKFDDVKKNLDVLYENKNKFLENSKEKKIKVNNGEMVKNINTIVFNNTIKKISCSYEDEKNTTYDRYIDCFNNPVKLKKEIDMN